MFKIFVVLDSMLATGVGTEQLRNIVLGTANRFGRNNTCEVLASTRVFEPEEHVRILAIHYGSTGDVLKREEVSRFQNEILGGVGVFLYPKTKFISLEFVNAGWSLFETWDIEEQIKETE
ncbi:MAG: hypothetical protein Q8N16_01900 [bacterium]|nr:hypothetical protein [bacterium]